MPTVRFDGPRDPRDAYVSVVQVPGSNPPSYVPKGGYLTLTQKQLDELYRRYRFTVVPDAQASSVNNTIVPGIPQSDLQADDVPVWDGTGWRGQPVGGGAELGYSEIAANAVLALTANTPADVPGLTTTITVRSRPILVEAWASAVTHSVAASYVQLRILEGSTIKAIGTHFLQTAAQGVPGSVRVRLAPSAGQHTYKIALFSGTAGNATLVAAATTPAFISAVER